MLPEFFQIVRQAFSPLAEAHDLRETGLSDTPALKRLVYSNDRRVVRFYLDVRDGYLDAQYGSREAIAPDGSLVEPAVRSAAQLGSMYAILKRDGLVLPDASEGLYAPGRLEQAVLDLVSGIIRYEDVVFGGA